MRETRDLLRRRTYLVHKRAELFTHLQILNAQYNLTPFAKKLCYATNREEMKIADAGYTPRIKKRSVSLQALLVGQIRFPRDVRRQAVRDRDFPIFHRGDEAATGAIPLGGTFPDRLCCTWRGSGYDQLYLIERRLDGLQSAYAQRLCSQ